MLHFKDFQKSYHHNPVLNIENLELDGGIYWVKGRNGSGKSTLLKSVAGLFSFTGDIFLGSLSLKKNGVAYRKLVNFADAEPVFPEFLTGSELIALFAGAKDAEAGQEIRFLEELDMQNYIHNPIGSYSSGMLKKLSLVLAFLGKPKLILLDEPLITIDVESLEIIYNWINESYEKHGTNFLLSSHQEINKSILTSARELVVEHQTLNL